MHKTFATAAGLGAFVAAALIGVPGSAQTMDTAGPHSPYCGSWVSGTWTPNGNCVTETTTTTVTTTGPADPDARAMPPNASVPQRVTGTIIAVRGHLVTLQQATHDIVIDDQPALDRGETGRVAVGRAVTAHGYWQGDTFFANRLETAS